MPKPAPPSPTYTGTTMFLLHGESKYALTCWNAFSTMVCFLGISLSGDRFFIPTLASLGPAPAQRLVRLRLHFQHDPLSSLDAGLCIRAKQKRPLPQPVCLEATLRFRCRQQPLPSISKPTIPGRVKMKSLCSPAAVPASPCISAYRDGPW